DFTGSGTTDIVLTQEIDGTEYPVFGRAKLGPSIYPVALRFPSYGSFAAASVAQLFGTAQLGRALHYQTDTFASVYLQNNGDGTGLALIKTPAGKAVLVASYGDSLQAFTIVKR